MDFLDISGCLDIKLRQINALFGENDITSLWNRSSQVCLFYFKVSFCMIYNL